MSISSETIMQLLSELSQSKIVVTFELIEIFTTEAKKNNISPAYKKTLTKVIQLLNLQKINLTFVDLGKFLYERNIVKSLNWNYSFLLSAIKHYEDDRITCDALKAIKLFW
jgi:hypothetical protein